MCCIVMATTALLLAYASFMEKRMKAAAAYLLLGVWAAVTLLATLSRSGLLAFAGVMVILVSAIIAGTAKHPARLLALVAAFIVLCGAAGVKITKDKMYEAAVEDYNLAVYNHETYGNPITVPKPEDRTISMDDLTSDRWGIWTTILENLTWNGHKDSVIWEWVAKDGAGDRHYNAHNAFSAWPTTTASSPACCWSPTRRSRSSAPCGITGARKRSPYAAAPAGVLHGVHSGGHVRIGLRAVLGDRLRVFSGSVQAALARGISPP